MTISRPLMFLALIACGSVHAEDCARIMDYVEMKACFRREAASADKELHQVYGRYRERLDASQKEMLKQVQLAWINFRDLSCRFETSSLEGASVRPMIMAACLEGRTRTRTQELVELAACREGDLSCPRPAQGWAR